ncbi:MAG: hypothetical protein JWO36_7053 [Myxococcales bacterium]|nr:hypothetical protein [Myxococcales bacterium]
MKSIAIVLAVILALPACKKSTTADCAAAIGKGVDQLSDRRKERMALRKGDVSPAAKADFDAQAKLMETFSAQLKTTLTNRCTEDKWPTEVIDCYEGAASPEDMRKCRTKLPADAADRARVDEVKLMMTITGSGSPAGRAAKPSDPDTKVVPTPPADSHDIPPSTEMPGSTPPK